MCENAQSPLPCNRRLLRCSHPQDTRPAKVICAVLFTKTGVKKTCETAQTERDNKRKHMIILLLCGYKYLEQTKRCANTWLREN